MWLYVPCPSAPASEESSLGLSSLSEMCARSLTSRGTRKQPKFWHRVLRTDRFRRLQFGRISQHSLAGMWREWLTSFAAASPASHGASPASVRERTMNAGSGPTSHGSFAQFDRDTSSWRTSQASLFATDSEPYSETWPRAGSMRNGCAYLRQPLALRTKESAFSSWPTASASVANDGESSAALNWPTPDARDSQPEGLEAGKRRLEKHSTQGLQTACLTWPTPRATDGDHGGPNQRDSAGTMGLAGAAFWATPNAHDGRRPGPEDGSTQGRNLKREAEWWTTPQAHDSAGGDPSRVRRYGTKHGAANLADDVTMWHTPNVPSGGRSVSAEVVAAKGTTPDGKRQVDLGSQTRHWATPASRDWRDGRASDATMERNARPLNEQANQWRTPNVCSPNSMRGGGQDPEKRAAQGHQVTLQDRVSTFSHPAPPTPAPGVPSSPAGRTLHRRLNPAFTAWMMGWPWWWTRTAPYNSARPEMESWRSSARSLLESSCGG